jgi:hypothetical protein
MVKAADAPAAAPQTKPARKEEKLAGEVSAETEFLEPQTFDGE